MAPTRLPAPVRIGPFTWTFTDDAKAWKDEAKHDVSHAICNTSGLQILIDPEAMEESSPGRLRMLVLHEVLHACFFSAQADVIMKDEDTAEESVVASTAPMLLQLLRDNPRFVAWLTA